MTTTTPFTQSLLHTHTRVAFDDALLVGASVSEFVNRGFDDGYGLPGWTPTGTGNGVVRVVEDTGPLDLAVEIAPDVPDAIGIAQSFDAFPYCGVNIDARVVFGTDAIVLAELVRPDGSIAATDSWPINLISGWVNVGVTWPDYTEDILTFRVSVINSPGVVVWFDNTGLCENT